MPPRCERALRRILRLRDLPVTEYDNDLLLAVATPERWLAPGREIVVKSAPTHFGPVSYTLRGGAGEVRGRRMRRIGECVIEADKRYNYYDLELR